MRPVPRLTTVLLVLLTAGLSAQPSPPPHAAELKKGDIAISRHLYDDALQAYKKAYNISGKTSLEALFGMALAYRGLQAHKNIVDLMNEATKLTADRPADQARVCNFRGMALVAMSQKPTDKRLDAAVADFRAALEANPQMQSARLNLGISLLKQGHDEDGRRELQRYVDAAPAGPDADSARKLIEEPRRAREPYAPDFSFTSKDGELVSSADLRGKTILLDFWATWCKPCEMATPGLAKLQQKYTDQPVVVISIAENDSEDSWTAYIEKHKMTWPQFFDRTGKYAEAFDVPGFPTYIVIDGDGIIRWRFTGYGGAATDRTVEYEIKQTLKKRD